MCYALSFLIPYCRASVRIGPFIKHNFVNNIGRYCMYATNTFWTQNRPFFRPLVFGVLCGRRGKRSVEVPPLAPPSTRRPLHKDNDATEAYRVLPRRHPPSCHQPFPKNRFPVINRNYMHMPMMFSPFPSLADVRLYAWSYRTIGNA